MARMKSKSGLPVHRVVTIFFQKFFTTGVWITAAIWMGMARQSHGDTAFAGKNHQLRLLAS